MNRTILCVALGSTLLLGGCVPHRDAYKQPPAPTPNTWNTGLPEQQTQAAAGAPAAAQLKWEEFFLDAKLRQVIKLSLQNNRDLRVAAANVEQTAAQYRLRRAALGPVVNAGFTANTYRVPAIGTTNNRAYTYSSTQAGLTVSSWEVDLFGRLRNLKTAAFEQYLATDEGRRATQVSLIASVASEYLTLAADRESLRLAQSTLEAQQATYNLIQKSRERGVKSDVDVNQALSQVQTAQVDLARYSAQVTLDENELNLLAGTQVPAELMPESLEAAAAVKDVSAGLPSEVLLSRPDVLQAEHELKSAYANIGAARAAYFPSLILTGGGGVASTGLSRLFSADKGTWQFAPTLSVPVFDLGTRKANYKIAQATRDAAVATYEKAIQSAFTEVSDGLSQRGKLLEQQNAQTALVSTLGSTYNLADARYKAGIDSYLTVLDAQRSLYGGQQALVSVRLARLTNLITLYKVLGGGVQ